MVPASLCSSFMTGLLSLEKKSGGTWLDPKTQKLRARSSPKKSRIQKTMALGPLGFNYYIINMATIGIQLQFNLWNHHYQYSSWVPNAGWPLLWPREGSVQALHHSSRVPSAGAPRVQAVLPLHLEFVLVLWGMEFAADSDPLSMYTGQYKPI